MALIDKITEAEEKAIMQWIHWYASYDSQLDKASLLKYWEDEKPLLAKAFGDKLILSKEISFKMGIEELDELISEKVMGYRSEASTFISAYRTLTARGGDCEYNYNMDSLLYTNTLATNVYDGTDFSIPLPNGKTLAVNTGCKVSKVLGKIATEFNLPGYEKFRILHSQALNQKNLRGNLCLSIHPLDYMTMSDNACGWDSCMSWENEGEYRRGTVEMMNSPYIVVAYLTAEDPFEIGEFKWSNKKWRELFFVNEDIITGIKPYPYHNEHLEEIVVNWLRDLVTTNLGWKYFDSLVSYRPNCDFEVEDKPFRFSFWTDTMYNDFGTRGDHIGYIGIDAPSNTSINYSGASQCMHCGEEGMFETEQDLMCCECDGTTRCYECGDRYSKDNLYELDGEYYCEYCYNNIAQECAICEENHHTNNSYDIHLGRRHPTEDGNAEIFNGSRITICENCYYALKSINPPSWVFKYLKPDAQMNSFTDYWTHYYWFDVADCTAEGLRLFGYDSIEDLEADSYDTMVIANSN